MLARITVSPVVRSVLSAILTLIGVAVAVFIMLRLLPGDQITASYGTESAGLDESQKADLERYYGIDKPLIVQFFTWIGALLTGNLGYSSRTHDSVFGMTLDALPVTVELSILAIVLSLVIGIPVGMMSASKPNGGRDWSGQIIGLAAIGIPVFLLASSLLSWTAQSFMFNPNGQPYRAPWENLGLNLLQMLLPAIVLGFSIAGPIIRTTRTSVLEVRALDFIRTAQAKGVPPRRLRWRHILRNALVPIVTMTGVQFGQLLGGAVVVEQIFSLPGIGRQVLLGMTQKEFAVVQSTVVIIALLFVVVNLLTDLFYRRLDPRVRAA